MQTLHKNDEIVRVFKLSRKKNIWNFNFDTKTFFCKKTYKISLKLKHKVKQNLNPAYLWEKKLIIRRKLFFQQLF